MTTPEPPLLKYPRVFESGGMLGYSFTPVPPVTMDDVLKAIVDLNRGRPVARTIWCNHDTYQRIIRSRSVLDACPPARCGFGLGSIDHYLGVDIIIDASSAPNAVTFRDTDGNVLHTVVLDPEPE